MEPSSTPPTRTANPNPPQNKPSSAPWVLLALILLALALVFAFLWHQRGQEISRLSENMNVTSAQDDARDLELARLQQEREALQARLTREQQEARNSLQQLEAKLREALAKDDIVITGQGHDLKVEVAEKILFPMGSADLLPEGKEMLNRLAATLEAESGRNIRIEGHADNVPFHPESVTFRSNWDLSAARALAAVAYLESTGRINPKRLSAAAYGEFRPLAPNDSDENRAKNRRIEILLVPSN